VLYEILAQKNDNYLGRLYETLDDLYVGGYQILAHAESFLPHHSQDTEGSHKDRQQLALYKPYFGQIVDQLASWLFSQEVTVLAAADAEDPETPGEVPDKPFYDKLTKNADDAGTSFAELVKGSVKTALTKRRAIIGADFPRVEPGEEPQSRIEEDAMGTSRAYLFEVPIEQMIDWETDSKTKALRWAVLSRVFSSRSSPTVMRSAMVTYEFKVWEIDESGFAKWSVYSRAYPKDQQPRNEDDIPMTNEGTTSFREIPLFVLELSEGLWVGNKIGPLCTAHFQDASSLRAAQWKSMMAIPVAALGPAIPGIGQALPAEITEDESRLDDPAKQFRERGWVKTGADDKLYFAEPTGSAYNLIADGLESLKDEIFRVVNLMAASVGNGKAQLGRSGVSKQQDKADTAIVLQALGADVSKYAVRIFTAVSRARGEDVKWKTHGLDEFATEDRETLIAEAVAMDQISIPSPTWKKEYKTDIALKLRPNLPPETQEQVRKEIQDGVDQEFEVKDIARDAEIEQTKANAANARARGAAPVVPPAVVPPKTSPPAPPPPRK